MRVKPAPKRSPGARLLPLLLALFLASCARPAGGQAGAGPDGAGGLPRPTIAPVPQATVDAATTLAASRPTPAPRPTVIVAEIAGDPAAMRLLDALRQRGIAPRATDRGNLPFLTVPSQGYQLTDEIGRERLFLHVYPSEGAARADAARVPPRADNGLSDWIDTPHFFRCEALIAVYLGRDPLVIGALADRCGPQFAGR